MTFWNGNSLAGQQFGSESCTPSKITSSSNSARLNEGPRNPRQNWDPAAFVVRSSSRRRRGRGRFHAGLADTDALDRTRHGVLRHCCRIAFLPPTIRCDPARVSMCPQLPIRGHDHWPTTLRPSNQHGVLRKLTKFRLRHTALSTLRCGRFTSLAAQVRHWRRKCGISSASASLLRGRRACPYVA